MTPSVSYYVLFNVDLFFSLNLTAQSKGTAFSPHRLNEDPYKACCVPPLRTAEVAKRAELSRAQATNSATGTFYSRDEITYYF